MDRRSGLMGLVAILALLAICYADAAEPGQAGGPAIEVTKTVIDRKCCPDEVTFKIDVANTGNSDLNQVEVVDTLPNGMTYSSDDHGGIVIEKTVTWNLGTLLHNSSPISIKLVAKIEEYASGLLRNAAAALGVSTGGQEVTDQDFADVEANKCMPSKEAKNAKLPKNAKAPKGAKAAWADC